METEIAKTESRFLDFAWTFAKDFAQGFITSAVITAVITAGTIAGVTAVAVVKDKIDSVRESHQKKTQTEN